MDIKKKIVMALSRTLEDPYIRLEDDAGVSGFVVSPRFKGMPTLDRQRLIDKLLKTAQDPLTPRERGRVLMIAGLSREEFDSVGVPVRIHKVRVMSGGGLELLLHGGLPDADYVRSVLENQDGVTTSRPKPPLGAVGVLMSFRAKGTAAHPLTKQKAVQILGSDPYIEVMPDA